MKAKHIFLILFAAVLTSGLITVGSLLFRQIIDYEDFRADRFGFPYYWVEHVLMNFAGPTDKWNINIENLAKNFTIYFITCFAVFSLTFVRKLARKRNKLGITKLKE